MEMGGVMATGAELVAQAVRAAGLDTVFLFPGGTIAPVIDALGRGGVRCVCLRHEQGAGYAALAGARLGNRPAVALVSSGPGVTNAVTCVADAYYDSVPLVLLTGQVGTPDLKRSRELRQRGFQEVDTKSLMASVAKAVFQPASPGDLRAILPEAFALAMAGRPGPVVIDLPMDVQRGEAGAGPEIALSCLPMRREPDADAVAAVIAALRAARRPVLLAGAGVALAGAEAALRAFIVRAPMPVSQSLPALGVFPTDHPLALGFHGHTGNQYAGLALQNADLVLVVGSRLDVRQTGTLTDRFAPGATVLRIEIDEAEIAHARVRVDLTLCADAASGLCALTRALEGQTLPDWSEWQQTVAGYRAAHPLPLGRDGALTAPRVVAAADRLTRDRAVVAVTGVGSHQQWAARHLTLDRPRRAWLTSAGHGTMGYDLPAALGAAFARPEALVLCFAGDGSVQLNIQELAALKEFELPVKLFVLDNRRFAIVSQFQKLNWGSDPTCGDKINPDFAALARAYGLEAVTISRLTGLEEALAPALASPKPVLIHCLIDSAEDISPMLLAGQTLDAMWTQPA